MQRVVDYDPFTPPSEKFELTGNANMNYSVGYMNYGSAINAGTLGAGPAIRAKDFALGWTPFFGNAFTSADDHTNWGSTLWLSWHAIHGEHWRLSIQPSYMYTQQNHSDDGCDNGIFNPYCQSVGVASSDTEIREYGLTAVLEKKISERDSCALIPAAYHTYFDSSDVLSGDLANDTHFQQNAWNYSLLVSYITRVNERTLLSVSGGLSYDKNFGAISGRKVLPEVHSQVSF